jgi:hypothetical protein
MKAYFRQRRLYKLFKCVFDENMKCISLWENLLTLSMDLDPDLQPSKRLDPDPHIGNECGSETLYLSNIIIEISSWFCRRELEIRYQYQVQVKVFYDHRNVKTMIRQIR